MESSTSTLTDSMFNANLDDNFGKKSSANSSNWIYILILLALFGFLYYLLNNNASQENMSGGTVSQLLLNDQQDLYLTGGPNGITDQLASGKPFQMYWNQPTRNGGNRSTYSPIPIISQKSRQKINELTSVNPSDLELNNAPFPRIDPKSTTSFYPGIKNILINQKENEEDTDNKLNKEMIHDQYLNKTDSNFRTDSMNTLQNALVNSCKSCVFGKCNNCKSCLNSRTSYPRGDLVASNKVDAKSIGLLDNDLTEDYESVENFDSGLKMGMGIGLSAMPAKMHNKLCKKLVKTNEKFDSGMYNSIMSSKDNLSNASMDNFSLFADNLIENFDSGIQHSTMPTKLHNKLAHKIVNKHENFNKDMIDLDNPLRENTGTCENCPQGRCINCPRRVNTCSDSANCALGYPCKTCKTLDYLNDRDQIVDADNAKDNNSREKFACACNRKVKIMTPTNLKQKYTDDNENFTKLIDNNSQKRESVQCSLNPDSAECNGCVNQCPCRLGNCSSCSDCVGEKCKSCPNRRCPCLMGRCADCATCRSGNCPMCPKNKVNNEAGRQIVNNNENFESVGFNRMCPCSSGKCTNCQECRMGKCDSCPRSKETGNFIDLASFGDGAGGYRLGGDFNKATTAPMSVNVTDNLVYYPDSYLGSFYMSPKPDIAYPYAVIPPSRTVGGLIADSGK